MASTTELLRYPTSSALGSDGELVLACAQDAAYFRGRLTHPRVAARSLLAVAAVARTRYYEPPGMVAARIRAADPVVTCAEERLRFESFSRCCGVHARFDVEQDGFTAESVRFGTTNVDVNPPMRAALAAVDDRSTLGLEVGDAGLTVRTDDAEAVERRVKLPERWVRGFAEVQVAAAGMVLRHELTRSAAVRFIRALPRSRSRGAPSWAVPAGDGLRIGRTPDDAAVCLPGPERLAEVRDLVSSVAGLRVYGPVPGGRRGVGTGAGSRPAEPSAWEFQVPGGRLTFTLSPQVERGFSGEGAILEALAFADDELAEDVARHLDASSSVDEARLAVELGRSRHDIRNALGELAAHGRVGYDLGSGAYFHREFPLGRELLAGQHPRLADARELVADGAVALDGDTAQVVSGTTIHAVNVDVDGATCTCPWFAKHRGERGPCKHVLAVQLVRARSGAQLREPS